MSAQYRRFAGVAGLTAILLVSTQAISLAETPSEPEEFSVDFHTVTGDTVQEVIERAKDRHGSDDVDLMLSEMPEDDMELIFGDTDPLEGRPVDADGGAFGDTPEAPIVHDPQQIDIPVNPGYPILGTPSYDRTAWIHQIDSTYTRCWWPGINCEVVDHHRYRITINPGTMADRFDVNYVQLVIGEYISNPEFELYSYDWFGINGALISAAVSPGLIPFDVPLYDHNLYKGMRQSVTLKEVVAGESKSNTYQTYHGYCYNHEYHGIPCRYDPASGDV